MSTARKALAAAMAPFAAALTAALFAANSTGPLPTGLPPAPLAGRPLATVVIGGLITATAITLFLLPSLYAKLGE